MNIIKINDNSNKLFYIGGVVRDELLGRESLDVDITYVGNAIEYCSKFGEVVQVNPDFGTVRVAIPPLLEITDFGQTWLFAVNGSTECSAGSTPTCASSALSSQSALPVGARGGVTFQKFIDQKIYKLVTPNDVEIPKVDIENLVTTYLAAQPPSCSAALWLIYVGILGDLSRLPLTKIEQKILDDVPKEVLKSDFELYKTFQNTRIETVLLYAITKDEIGARHYLDDLREIKLDITGKDLQTLGIKPSPKYQVIFDEVLKAKLQNPKMTKTDEIEIAKKYLSD